MTAIAVADRATTTAASPTSALIGLRRVVVATDLSPGSLRALRRAAALPYRPNALVVLVHVLDSSLDKSIATVVGGAAEIALERAAKRLAGWLEDRHRGDVRIQVRLPHGESPWAEIDRIARRLKADLVCVGRRGQSRLRQLVLGTTARRLVRRGSGPVLLVNRAPKGPYRKAVVGVDFTAASRAAARLARRLVPAAGRLSAIHAVEDPLRGVPEPLRPDADHEARELSRRQLARRTRSLRRLVDPLAVGERPWTVQVELGDPRHLLFDAAAESKADLVAVGTAGRTGVNRMLIGSVAESVLEHSRQDVLVVRHRSDRKG